MMTKGDPLSVLLAVRSQMDSDVDEELIQACYQLQKDHQYDKDRNTRQQMKALVEETMVKNEGDVHL